MIEIEAAVVLLILFAAFLLGAVGLGFVLGRTTMTKPYGDLWVDDEIDHDERDRIVGAALVDKGFTNEPPEEEHATLPVDPLNPPSWRTYSPKQPSADPKRCLCHGDEIKPGSKVLWWPNPSTQGVDLLCEKGVAEAESLKDIL